MGLQFGPFRAEYSIVIQIALTGVCAVSTLFLLTFLKVSKLSGGIRDVMHRDARESQEN